MSSLGDEDDDFDLGDFGDDGEDFLGLDDGAFDLDGDGGFFLGEASKALHDALADLSDLPKAKEERKDTRATLAAGSEKGGAADDFLSKLLADREAELKQSAAGTLSPPIVSSSAEINSGALLSRKKSTMALDAVANSIKSMAHLSLKRGADGTVSTNNANHHTSLLGGRRASSRELLDATLAGRGGGGGGGDPFASTKRDDEAITDEEYTEVDLGRRKLKLLLQRFITDYREHLFGIGGELQRVASSPSLLTPSSSHTYYGKRGDNEEKDGGDNDDEEGSIEGGAGVVSVVDESPLLCGEFERLVVRRGGGGVASSNRNATAAAPPRSLADIKKTLRDVCKAQEARVAKIKSLINDGEGGMSDPMFVKPPENKKNGFILPVRTNSDTNKNKEEEETGERSGITLLQRLSAEERAKAMFPSSDEDDTNGSDSLRLDSSSSSSSSFLNSEHSADKEGKDKKNQEAAAKKARRSEREAKRREAVIKFKREAILGSTFAGGGGGGGGEEAGVNSPASPLLGDTSAGLRKTLEALGFGNPHTSPDSDVSDLRGMAYAFVEQLLMIHEEAMVAITKASDFIKVPLKGALLNTASPLRRVGLGPRSDEFISAMDAAIQQGWEILFVCLNGARELPMADFVFPATLKHVLNKFLLEWRGAYQLTCLFALKFAIALNTRIGLEFCGKVLRHADCFQTSTIETAMVCVAEEALEGTLTDALVWIGPILAVMRMLADNPGGVSAELLVLALDVLMFTVLGAGNAAMQFISEGGLAVLADVLLAIDPLVIKPEVTKRILKLLNPTSLGVKPHGFLTTTTLSGDDEKDGEGRRDSNGAARAAVAVPAKDEHVASPSESAKQHANGATLIAEDNKAIGGSITEGYAFPTDEPIPSTTASSGHGAENPPPPLLGLSHSKSANSSLLKEDGNEVSKTLGNGNTQAGKEADELVFLSEDDYREIIRALEIAMEKYDGQSEERNSQAQKEAAQTKADAQRHKQAEAQTRAVKKTGGPDFNAVPPALGRSRIGSGDTLDDSHSPSPSSPVSSPQIELPPSTADNQVLDECTFIVYAILMVNIEVAVNEGVMQLLARHVIGSDVFWNNKQTMRGVLGCVQTLLHNYSLYEAEQSRYAAGVGGAVTSGLVSDASIVLESSTINVTPGTPFLTRRVSRRLAGGGGGADAALLRMGRAVAGSGSAPAYYRVIMDPPTLAVLSLAVRCYSDVDVSHLPHVAQVYKALYVLVSAEPARMMLVNGCPDLNDDDALLASSVFGGGPPVRSASMRRRVSIATPLEDRGPTSPLQSRRASFSKQGQAETTAGAGRSPSILKPGDHATTSPQQQHNHLGIGVHTNSNATSNNNSATTPPYNALIPCLLYALTRTAFIQQKRYTISLLNKVIKGAYRPACLQLLGALPVGIIFQPPLHQGRRSRHSIAFKNPHGSGHNFQAFLASHRPTIVSSSMLSPSDPPPAMGGAAGGAQQQQQQRPGLGGISSGAIAPKTEPAGAFLRFVSKFVGTAPPELIPPLLALIREVGRFLSHSGSADVFDQHLIQAILRSVVSIVQNYEQEVAVVAGGCMALGHLCRIPHSQPNMSLSQHHLLSPTLTFALGRHALSSSLRAGGGSGGGGPAASVFSIDGAPSAALNASSNDNKKNHNATEGDETSALSAGKKVGPQEGEPSLGVNPRHAHVTAGPLAPTPSLSSPQSARFTLETPTPTLSFALESESLLDLAIGLISANFILPTPSSSSTPAGGEGGRFTVPPSASVTLRKPSTGLGGGVGEASLTSWRVPASTGSSGPSPVVRRTLGFLLAVIAMDPDGAQSIIDEGGLALLQDSGGVRTATSSTSTTPTKVQQNYHHQQQTPDRRADVAASSSFGGGALTRQHSLLAGPNRAADALAALLTREERELCKRQYLRLMSIKEAAQLSSKLAAAAQQQQASTSSPLGGPSPSTAADQGASKSANSVEGGVFSSSVLFDAASMRVRILLDATAAMAVVSEEERALREVAVTSFFRESEVITRLSIAAEVQRRKERTDLEVFQMEMRRRIEEFASESLLDIVRNAQRAANKKLLRVANAAKGANNSYNSGGPPPTSTTAAEMHKYHQYEAAPASPPPQQQEQMQVLLETMVKMQESHMRMQAEMLLAVQQGALSSPPYLTPTATFTTRPLSASYMYSPACSSSANQLVPLSPPQLSMATVASPRPTSVSLRPLRAHPPPTFARGNLPPPPTPHTYTASVPTDRTSPSSSAAADGIASRSATRPVRPQSAAAASISARRDQTLGALGIRPSSSPSSSPTRRTDKSTTTRANTTTTHHRAGGEEVGRFEDENEDSFIQEDDGDEDEGQSNLETFMYERPAPQASKALTLGVHEHNTATASLSLRPSTPRRPASGVVRVPAPPGLTPRVAQRLNTCAAPLISNASVDQLVSLLLEECVLDSGNSNVRKNRQQTTAAHPSQGQLTKINNTMNNNNNGCFNMLTHLDLSRNYLGDTGLARLIEVLSLHSTTTSFIGPPARPSVLPYLSSLSLQQNGITGLHLPSLLFEALGVPLSDRSTWCYRWSSPPPFVQRISEELGDSDHRTSSSKKGSEDNRKATEDSLSSVVAGAPWLAVCEDKNVRAVVEGVVTYLLPAVKRARSALRRIKRDSKTDGGEEANEGDDPVVVTDENNTVALLRVAVPCDYVTIGGVRVAIPLDRLSVALSALLTDEHNTTCTDESEVKRKGVEQASSKLSISFYVGEQGDLDDFETSDRNEGVQKKDCGTEAGAEERTVTAATTSNEALKGDLAALLDRLRSMREQQRALNPRRRQPPTTHLHVAAALSPEESSFFRPIRYLDLSHNLGITPGCNRDVLAYVRLNHMLSPMMESAEQRELSTHHQAHPHNAIVSNKSAAAARTTTPPHQPHDEGKAHAGPTTPLPPPPKKPQGGQSPSSPFPRRPLSALTAHQAAKTAIYNSDAQRAACPLVLDGTSLFTSTIDLASSVVTQREGYSTLLFKGIVSVFKYCWRREGNSPDSFSFSVSGGHPMPVHRGEGKSTCTSQQCEVAGHCGSADSHQLVEGGTGRAVGAAGAAPESELWRRVDEEEADM